MADVTVKQWLITSFGKKYLKVVDKLSEFAFDPRQKAVANYSLQHYITIQ